MRRALPTLIIAAALAGAAASSAGAAAGADAKPCGHLPGTRAVDVIGYSTPCSTARAVIKSAIGSKRDTHEVSGRHRGFTCSGKVSSRRVSVSCRRNGGAQFITARGRP